MITLFTAIAPEKDAVLSLFPMKRVPSDTLTLYEAEGLRLLVTGSGKLPAALAVTEYLCRYPYTETDIFCNVGICGAVSGASLGDGFLCASVTDLLSERSLYPENGRHPFPEAQLYTSETPVTENAGFDTITAPLPLLADMEGYGIASALFRLLSPSRCFFYKVVSDVCDGNFPGFSTVTNLLVAKLPTLVAFLKEREALFICADAAGKAYRPSVTANVKRFCDLFPCSTTMERRVTGLFTYAEYAGISTEPFFSALPDTLDTPHKKQAAQMQIQRLEQELLAPSAVLTSVTTGTAAYLTPFSHIYVERQVWQLPMTQRILQRFPKASVILIDHYKDVFNRSRQNLAFQKSAPDLILAANKGTKFYPGAPVCQSFNEEHFMYTSCIMNCLYDCDYCYLQGMYPSKNIVVFVNLEEYFEELEALLLKHPVYLSCSYESDLTAFNGIFPHAEAFCLFAKDHPGLRLELRTKSAAKPFLQKLPSAKNIVVAFTLSPQELISKYEHYAPSLSARLATAKEAAKRGFSLRLCFDPLLDVPEGPALYEGFLDRVFEVLTPEEITDISIGIFRLSKDYLKQLKKANPSCALSHYPYEQTRGVCHYNKERTDALLLAVRSTLLRHGIREEQIFSWTPAES